MENSLEVPQKIKTIIELACDPATPLLGIYLKKSKTQTKKIYAPPCSLLSLSDVINSSANRNVISSGTLVNIVSQKVCSEFSVMASGGKPERTFWPTQYLTGSQRKESSGPEHRLISMV